MPAPFNPVPVRAMHISPRPIYPPIEGDPVPRRRGSLGTLVFALCALLAMVGTILLSDPDGGLATLCADSPAACGGP